MLEYFLKPQLSPSVSGLTGFILGEQAALNPSLNPGKASPDALNQALGLNSKILLATMRASNPITDSFHVMLSGIKSS